MAENNKTAAKKAAENQKAETDAVIDTDPTEAGANTDLATAGVGDDAVVLKAGDPVDDSVFAKTEAGDEFVTLAKDVVEEFYFPDTKRPSYRLLYTKGQTVRRSAIETVNAAAKAKAAREGGDGEVKLENYIDSSTIASGTGSQPPVED